MSVAQYIRELNRLYAGGNATEHTYRTALTALLQAELAGASVVNEPKQIECGAPDLLVQRNGIAFGYVETKNIGKNLDDAAYKDQLTRYTNALENFIFTDYLEFRRYQNGVLVQTVRIGEVRGEVVAVRKNVAEFGELLQNFSAHQGRLITSADELAKRMAMKARLLKQATAESLQRDEQAPDRNETNSALLGEFEAIKRILIHDISTDAFADIYAQTIAYGMFAARLQCDAAQNFSRSQAAELIPHSNPFLRKFFHYIAGFDLDKRIRPIVDDLANLFRIVDVEELMSGHGKATRRTDPFMHFYETFLGKYNPKLRKSRGVYYTPEPVVDFIVRAVDDLLQSKFGLSRGLADTGKTEITLAAKDGETEAVTRQVHRVQILDPATGTGTFLAAIVRHIYEHHFVGQQGVWAESARDDLVPRLNGFEVLMASYAMAHTKLEMVLRQSGCDLGDSRLRVYLTNSLEEHHPDTQSIFAQWLSQEANEANQIKRETPVMVVIGNPPYAMSSSNDGAWIKNLIDAYKQDLDEQNIAPLSDDYIKFIRYGEHLVQRTEEGILAYISNNSFIKGIIHRQMRKHLLETFDEIYILDLHGNSRIKETAPDGSADENVFDIMQGVSINLLVKTGAKKSGALARVFHCDLYGKRESKYAFLNAHNLSQVKFKKINVRASHYFFVPKDYSMLAEYEKGFSLPQLFPVCASGIKTHKDRFTIHIERDALIKTIAAFRTMNDDVAREKFALGADNDWKVNTARRDLEDNVFNGENDSPVSIDYRPFDTRYTYYTGKSNGFHSRPRGEVMRHYIAGENVGLLFKRGDIEEKAAAAFITKHISDSRSWSSSGMQGIESSAPLYLYPEPIPNTLEDRALREPNLNMRIVKTIADSLGLRFVVEKQNDAKTFAPIDLLDYIYAVLHSPAYREKYIEFLKIDFPRVPYPKDAEYFWQLAKLGGELRALHLLQSDALDSLITTYPYAGDHHIAKVKFELTDPTKKIGKVQINDRQFFGGVPQAAWEFFIGGYQPAQKYLKDRKNRVLTAAEITHYQKIIVALVETARLMKAVDGV